MTKIITILFFLSLLVSCATQPHFYDGDKRNTNELAKIFENTDEVILISIDSKPVKRGRGWEGLRAGAFVLPGKHKLTAKYSWTNYYGVIGGVFATSQSYKSGIKTICFIAEAGKDYQVKSTPPSIKDWRLYLSNGAQIVLC